MLERKILIPLLKGLDYLHINRREKHFRNDFLKKLPIMELERLLSN